MEITIEFVLFVAMFLVSVFAAFGMLLSSNAVHSALFLVLNFACVAFLYLILQAAFLAMVQVAVYAGAIMVLFTFVIMLLGAEKLATDEQPYPWLVPASIGLGSLFLLTAGLGILNSDISAEDPEPLAPMARVINVIPDYETIDVRLNGQTLAEELSFREESDLTKLEAGAYTVEAVAIAEDGSEISLPLSLLHYTPAMEVEAAEVTESEADHSEEAVESEADHSGEATTEESETEAAEESAPMIIPASLEVLPATVTLTVNSYTTFVLTPLEDGTFGIIPVAQDLNTVELSKAAHLQVVHAIASSPSVDVAEITQADRKPNVIVEGLGFGGYSEVEVTHRGELTYGLYEAGIIDQIAAAEEDYSVVDVPEITQHHEDDFLANTSTLYIIAPPLNAGISSDQHPEMLYYRTENVPAFGGPVSVGRLLFTKYMLPFQVTALLLLVAMIGAIVLTRDQVAPPRQRFPRRLASTGAPVVGGDEE